MTEHASAAEPVRETAARRPEAAVTGQTADAPLMMPAGRGSAGQLLHLQRSAGNRAVTALARRTSAPPAPRRGPTVQRRPDGLAPAAPTEDVAALIETAHQSKKPGDVKAIGLTNLHRASEEYRFDFIHTLAYQGWVGPLDEYALEALWGTFEDKVLQAAAKQPEYWKKSMEGGAELYKLPAVKAIPPRFLDDVRALAGDHLTKNDEYAKKEMADLGAPVDGATAAKSEDAQARMAALQKSAKVVTVAQAAQKALSEIAVGYDMAHDEDSSKPSPGQAAKLPGSMPVGFSHTHKPWIPNVASPTHEEVDKQWEVLEQIITGEQAKNPAIYAIMAHGDQPDLGTVATGTPEQGRGVILGSLKALREHISSTRPKLAGHLAYELTPIHGQLFSGTAKGPSGVDWHEPAAHALGEDVLGRQQDTDFLVTLGLSTIAAAAFVLAEIATGGLATGVLMGVGVGTGAGMAAASWEKAYTLAQAQKTSVSKDTELVASGQAEAATVEAVINTVMVFIDMYAAGKAAVTKLADAAALVTTPEAAGAARALVVGLDKLSTMPKAEAVRAIEASIAQVGIKATEEKSGLTAMELLTKVGFESPVAERLQAYLALKPELAKLTAEELGQKLALLPAQAAKDPQGAQAVLQVAIEKLGPRTALTRGGGWATLVRVAGQDGPGMLALKAWRDAALADTASFLEHLAPEAIKAAGGNESELAARFLAARLGGTLEDLGVGTARAAIEGTGEKELAAMILKASDARALVGKGLLSADSMAAMAKEGLALKEAWKTMTPLQRIEELFKLGNARLREVGVPEFRSFLPVKDEGGAFVLRKWELQFDIAILTDDTKFAWLLEATYHEARHAEQVFAVARLKAGEGWTVEQMVASVSKKGLGIDQVAAEKALAEKAAGRAISADSPEGRQAAEWFESLAGTGAPGREAVYKSMDTALQDYAEAVALLKKSEGMSADVVDMFRARRDREWQAYLKKVDVYKKLPEEADAYKVSDKIRQVIAEHDKMLRDEAVAAAAKPPAPAVTAPADVPTPADAPPDTARQGKGQQ